MSWTLEADGDRFERDHHASILLHFPQYEEFWRIYVVPITFRVVDRGVLYVRRGVPLDLQEMATAHYSVFLRLAFAHEVLSGPESVSRLSSFYHFYVDLYGAGKDMLKRFLRTTKKVLGRYSIAVPSEFQRRVSSWGDQGLSSEYSTLIEEVDAYRNLIHDPVLVMLNGRVPRAEFLERGKTRYRNLSHLADLLVNPAKATADYIDCLDVASHHFESSLKLLNRIWVGVMAEFAGLASKSQYAHDQSVISEEDRSFLRTVSRGARSDSFSPVPPPSGEPISLLET